MSPDHFYMDRALRSGGAFAPVHVYNGPGGGTPSFEHSSPAWEGFALFYGNGRFVGQELGEEGDLRPQELYCTGDPFVQEGVAPTLSGSVGVEPSNLLAYEARRRV
jgi:hypothetical protein